MTYKLYVEGLSGVVSFWPLDETSGTNADDPISGFDGTYTPNGGTVTLSDRITAISDPAVAKFVGGAYVTIPDQNALSPQAGLTGLISVIADIYVTDLSTIRFILTKGGGNAGTGGENEYQFRVNADGSILFSIDAADGSSQVMQAQSSAGVIAVNTKYHVIGTYDRANTRIKVYVNGVQVASSTTVVATQGTAGSMPVEIGRRRDLTSSLYMVGDLGHVAILNRELSSSEVTTLWNYFQNAAYPAEVVADGPLLYWKFEDANGITSPVDSSGNSKTGSIWGTPSPGFGDTPVFPSLGTSLGLSGGGSTYAYRPADSVWNFGIGDFSVEFPVRDNNSLSNYSELFGLDNVASGNGLILYINQTTGTLRFWCGGSVMNGVKNIIDGSSHLITITRESGVVKFYVDGVLDATGTLSGSLLTNQALHVGIGSGDYPSLIGRIGHFSLYNHALSAARVTAHYDALVPPTPGADLAKQDAESYIYENVGFSVVNHQEAAGEIYENIGYHVISTQEAHGEVMENVGVTNPNSKEAIAYIYEDDTIFILSYWGQPI